MFSSLISWQPGIQVADLRQRYDAIGSGHDIQSPREGGTASAGESQLRDETSSQPLQHLATFLYPKKDRRKAEDEVRVLSAEAHCELFQDHKQLFALASLGDVSPT